jgi:hypothetical protein
MRNLASGTLVIVLALATSFAVGAELRSAAQFTRDKDQICTEKWTKRGVRDQNMWSYCMTQHTEAYAELAPFHRQYQAQSWYYTYALPYCNGKWTERDVSDATMIIYCLKNELEGQLDYNYYLGKEDATTVNRIANNALATFKSWQMVSYELDNHFK